MTKKDLTTRVFVVEDDPMYLRMIKYVMELNPDHEVHCFTSGKDCLDNLYRQPDIVSLDFSLPDMDGGVLLRKIKQVAPNAGVIMLSGQKDVRTAIGLLHEGAYDYITKDAETKERLIHALQNLKNNLRLTDEVEGLKIELADKKRFEHLLVGESPAIDAVVKQLQKAALTNITVSLTGETGSGKELAAKAIHYNSSRRKGPFVAVNMSAIPKELVESELFGYEKGAFTGAASRKKGQFELADKGTLFLDEIGELALSVQSKLLRAIQEREIMRVGGEQAVQFDTRIIVATHKDLAEEVANGNFREDLYYRLLGFPITMPPLRARGHDVILLANTFLQEFAKQNGLGALSLSKQAKEKLLGYNFPGNVRELRAIIELAAVLANDGRVEAEDIRFSSLRKINASIEPEGTLEDIKNRVILHYLERYNGDVMMVAQKLDIGKSTIYRLLQNGK